MYYTDKIRILQLYKKSFCQPHATLWMSPHPSFFFLFFLDSLHLINIENKFAPQ